MSKYWKGYKGLVRSLEALVVEFYGLTEAQNPVMRVLNTLPHEEVDFVIKEYSKFSLEAVHMLLDARIRTYPWTKLSKEIDRNIREEKGSKTLGVPHLEIMRSGYEASLDYDVNSYEPTTLTENFLSSMRRIFQNHSTAYVAGAVLAFETVSIPEFYVLDALVKKHVGHTGKRVSSDLLLYIEGHKQFEVDHKNRLFAAIRPYVCEYNSGAFRNGYFDVCATMSKWWEGLKERACSNS